MLKISQKMGGLPTELSPVLQKIEDTAMTLHEAAKRGDLAAVKSFLERTEVERTQRTCGDCALRAHKVLRTNLRPWPNAPA